MWWWSLTRRALLAAALVRASSQTPAGSGGSNSSIIAAPAARSGAVWATPHEQFSSSAGVLGCKIDTNRVAYWPGSVDCDDICVSLSYGGRTVKLLRIDSSEGAHDISYDAWNYLYTGQGAAEAPTTGGPVAMDWSYVDPSECADLIHTDDHKLPFSAPTGTGLLVSCLLNKPESWVAKNHVLYNIIDAICSWGYDETCTLDWPAANQAACPHTLGALEALTSTPVYNIQYGTGQEILASTGEVVEGNGGSASSGAAGGSGGSSGSGGGSSGGSSGSSSDSDGSDGNAGVGDDGDIGGIGVKGFNGAISSVCRVWPLVCLSVTVQCVLLSFF